MRTLEDHMDRWAAAGRSMPGRSPATAQTYRTYVRQFCRWAGEGAAPDRFSEPGLTEFYYSFLTEGERRSGTVAVCIYALRSFGEYLRSIGAIPENYARCLSVPRPEVPRRRVVPDEVAFACEDACERIADEDEAALARALIAILRHGGLRFSEILNMKVGDVRHGPSPSVDVTRGKGGKARTVPLCDAASAALRAYEEMRPDDCEHAWFWWYSKTRRIARKTVRNVLANLYAIAGYRGANYNPHAWRHCFATWLIMLTNDYTAVADLMGHDNPGFTFKFYSHSNEHRNRIVANLSDRREMLEKIKAVTEHRRTPGYLSLQE